LVNGSLRSSLKQAIIARANAFLEKYFAIKEISEFYDNIYKKVQNKAEDKISRIQQLIEITEVKHKELREKYKSQNLIVQADGKEKGVVIANYNVTTKSGIDGDSQEDSSKTTVKILPIATQTLKYDVTVQEGKHTTNPVINAPGVMTNSETIEIFSESTKKKNEPNILSEMTESTHCTRQTTTTNLVDFKDPSTDASIEYQKMQLELQDELLKHQIISKKVENMKRIMENELKLLELDINRLQHAFLQTLLISPIDGMITAVYKDPGDYVNPGEPVVRVENDKELLIVGFIQCRELLKVKRKVTLKTIMFENFEQEEKIIHGEIVAIRGHDADDDEWDVIIHCKNDDRKIPINYHFDKDNTTIEFP
jgi:acetyl/propionyl-CoA carboxylase alpha subunit